LPRILMVDNDLGLGDKSTDYSYCKNAESALQSRRAQLIGGTHFVMAKPEFQQHSLDYLFIDEAGQFSLAAALVCSFAAKNIILLGDQMQLEQVNVGQHPGESGLSVLSYYMNGQSTIARTHGIFLDQTWRMHPNITGFLSEMIYDKRLSSHERTEKHRLQGSCLPEQGILFVPVDHWNNSMRSEEEGLAIKKIVAQLQEAKVLKSTGQYRKFEGGEEDLIVITPYNAQVELIRSSVKGIKVGSVDLFQGQEAWVSILSMCASGEEGLHRGLDFLLSKNRLNVALSRAKALSIVVGSPRLLEIRPRQMKTIPLLNFYAALVASAQN
jgi:superfamily I DNA and/or RNA helicase